MALTEITVSGTYLDADSNPAEGFVHFALNQVLKNVAHDVLATREPIVARLNGSGTVTAVLVATNDPGTLPVDATYNVTEEITGAPKRSYSIFVPYNGGPIDLVTVAPVEDSVAVPVNPITLIRAETARAEAAEEDLQTQVDGKLSLTGGVVNGATTIAASNANATTTAGVSASSGSFSTSDIADGSQASFTTGVNSADLLFTPSGDISRGVSADEDGTHVFGDTDVAGDVTVPTADELRFIVEIYRALRDTDGSITFTDPGPITPGTNSTFYGIYDSQTPRNLIWGVRRDGGSIQTDGWSFLKGAALHAHTAFWPLIRHTYGAQATKLGPITTYSYIGSGGGTFVDLGDTVTIDAGKEAYHRYDETNDRFTFSKNIRIGVESGLSALVALILGVNVGPSAEPGFAIATDAKLWRGLLYGSSTVAGWASSSLWEFTGSQVQINASPFKTVPAKAATTAAIVLTAPGAAIDGVTMVAGDRFLNKDAAAPAENGVYIWNGASSTATRATDMDSAAEVASATVAVQRGTVNGGKQFSTTFTAGSTLGSTAMTWVRQLTTADSTSFVPVARTLVSKTANYTLLTTDDVCLADSTSGAFQVTLPTAVGVTGQTYTIKRTNSGANAVTVGTTSAQTIDGSTTAAISVQYVSLTVVSDGANWNII